MKTNSLLLITLFTLLLCSFGLQAETINRLIAADQAKTELDQAHETAALHKQQAKEQVAAKKDQHEVDIAALESEIATLENKITELKQQHAQELIDLQKAHHEQEKVDTHEIQSKELEVVRTQAIINRMSNQGGLGKRGEHWGEGAVTGKPEKYTEDN